MIRNEGLLFPWLVSPDITNIIQISAYLRRGFSSDDDMYVEHSDIVRLIDGYLPGNRACFFLCLPSAVAYVAQPGYLKVYQLHRDPM